MDFDRSYDKQNAYKVNDKFYQQIQEAWKLAKDIKITNEIDKIVIAGMGGSGLPGVFLRSYLDLDIPIFLVRGYFLPKHINNKSLVFSISYSGNTEEAISCYKEAVKRKCRLIVISSGGKLLKLSKLNKTPHVNIPTGYQPRAAYGYQFFPILRILQNSNLIEKQDDYVEHLVKILKKNKRIIQMAKDLAEKLYQKIPIIYTSEKLYAVGYKWKISFNENTKILAFNNFFPELNHNETNGLMKHIGKFHCIMIRDDEDFSRIRKRMKITKGLLKKYDIEVSEILISGNNLLTKIFSAIYIGDWTTYWLALLYKIDPSTVEIIESLKKQLGPFIR